MGYMLIIFTMISTNGGTPYVTDLSIDSFEYTKSGCTLTADSISKAKEFIHTICVKRSTNGL